MAERPTLYTSPGSHHSRRVALLIHELGVDVEQRHVDVRPPGMGGETESEAFLALNPNGKVPVLVDGDLTVFESNAIMAYLCDRYGPTELYPEDRARRALVQQWQYWQAAHLSPTADGLLGEHTLKPMMGGAPDEATVAQLEAEFHRWATVLDKTLKRREHLAGPSLTCADLSVATALMYATAARLPVAEHAPLDAWLARVQSRPSWKDTTPPPLPV
ncbi:MAG: glutathione S-transferase family protein [Sandaracinaceae bacterium]